MTVTLVYITRDKIIMFTRKQVSFFMSFILQLQYIDFANEKTVQIKILYVFISPVHSLF